mgnify:CR=1 FL=1
MLDVSRLRSWTPGCESLIHFDNAGMALPSQATVDRVKRHLDLEANEGGYHAANAVNDELEGVYEHAAALVGGRPDQIALVDSATRAWNIALDQLDLPRGARVLIGANEYGSNVLALLRRGLEVVVAPEDALGQVDVRALDSVMKGVRLVALTHVATNSGLVQPAEEVGKVAARWGVPYLLDACQSAGQVPLDVEGLGCTALAATGRKYLRGPRGTGILWMKDCGEPFTLDARGAVWTAPSEYVLKPGARRYELWERNIAGLLGLGVALAQLHGAGVDVVSTRIASLAETLREGLPNVQDRGARRCGIVTFLPDRIAPYALKAALREERMNVSVSEVDMTRLDMEARGLTAVVRASVHAYNTQDEIARFCAAVGRLS